MDTPRSRSGVGKDHEIAAAEWLLQDTPAQGVDPSSSRPTISPKSSETFELADDSGDIATRSASTHPTEPVSKPTIRKAEAEASRKTMGLHPSAPVEQVWSRASEWGPTLVVLACWVGAIALLFYLTLGAESYELATILLLVGCLGAIVLSYPILITLERPVRVTPEQAARDYYGALSHHLPHFRRMWLLLSARGRVSAQFASYEGFKKYWHHRLKRLREGYAGSHAPLVFMLEDFRAEKSAGRTVIDGSFKVQVFVRGRRSDGPVWSLLVETSFARGPDGMWYLDDGTLAERPKASGG